MQKVRVGFHSKIYPRAGGISTEALRQSPDWLVRNQAAGGNKYGSFRGRGTQAKKKNKQ